MPAASASARTTARSPVTVRVSCHTRSSTRRRRGSTSDDGAALAWPAWACHARAGSAFRRRAQPAGLRDRVAVCCHRCDTPGWVIARWEPYRWTARFRCTGCSSALDSGDWVGRFACWAASPVDSVGISGCMCAGGFPLACLRLHRSLARCAQCDRSTEVTVTTRPLRDAEPADPHFGLPLRLVESTRAGLLWAYNAEHLQALHEYTSATLREGRGHHRSMFSRLPQWMKLARNRVLLQRAVARLQRRLLQVTPAVGRQLVDADLGRRLGSVPTKVGTHQRDASVAPGHARRRQLRSEQPFALYRQVALHQRAGQGVGGHVQHHHLPLRSARAPSRAAAGTAPRHRPGWRLPGSARHPPVRRPVRARAGWPRTPGGVAAAGAPRPAGLRCPRRARC